MLTAKLSSKGQIVIPKGVRERLNISSGTFFNIRLQKEDIVLTPVKATPIDRLYGKFAGETILDELEKEHAEDHVPIRSSLLPSVSYSFWTSRMPHRY